MMLLGILPCEILSRSGSFLFVVRKYTENSGIRYGFGRVFVESISNAINDGLETVQLSGKPGGRVEAL